MVSLAGRRRICALAALACLGPAMAGCRDGADDEATRAAEGPRTIVALGRLEPKGGVLEIGAVPGDILQSIAEGVVEGSVVAAGAEMARLESYDLRASQLEAIDAKISLGEKQEQQELAVAQANHEQSLAAKAEVDAKLEELEAQAEALDSLDESARIAESDYQSLLELKGSDPELVTEIQLRRKKNLAERARKEFEVQSRTHAAAKKAAEAAVTAAAQNVALAKLNLEMAEQINQNIVNAIEKKVAEETLQQSILRAPDARDDGPGEYTVLKVFVEPGEFITQLPVFQIGNLSRMTCIAEVYEADVKELEIDQQATIRSPAFSKPFADDAAADGGPGVTGRVVRIGSLVSNGGLIQRNPLAPSDRSIVEVLIEIEGDGAAATRRATQEAARHIGLQVTVTFGDKPGASAQVDAPSESTDNARGPAAHADTASRGSADPAS